MASSDVRVLSMYFEATRPRERAASRVRAPGTTSAATTTFSDVDFLENSAGGNGGAANMGEHASGTADFERVLVSMNTAGGDSGGIHLYRNQRLCFRDSTFRRQRGG